MESDPEAHPMSDIAYIAEQLTPVVKEKKDALMAAFKEADVAGTGFVSYEILQVHGGAWGAGEESGEESGGVSEGVGEGMGIDGD